MRRRGGLLFVAAVFASAWLGCNALLGIESAVFDTPAVSEAGDERPIEEHDGAVTDSSVDALDASDAGPPCVDTLVNIHHCGSCGHDCLGGACSGGKCLPAVVATDVAGGFSIAIDETHVYWTNPATGEIKRAPKSGGAPSVLFSKADTTLGEGIFVRGGQLYFATADEDGGILHCPKTGCGGAGPAVDVSAPVTVFDIADGGLVSFGTSTNKVSSCTLPCAGAPVDVATGEGVLLSVASAPGFVVWSHIPLQLRARDGNDAIVTLDNGGRFIKQVVIAGDQLIYAQLNRGPRVALRDGGAQRDLRASVAAAVNTDHVTTFGNDVFFNDYASSGIGGKILACPMAGCDDGGGVIAIEQAAPRGIAVDDQAIYWVNEGDGDAGSIMRLAR